MPVATLGFPIHNSRMKFIIPLLALTASTFAHDANVEMAKAATAFLSALTSDQKTEATFPFKTEEKDERTNWHFIPRERKGLTIKEMTEPQRVLARALLRTGLSDDGVAKAEQIQSLESILREMEAGQQGKPVRDPERYFVSVFGTPGGKEPWGWRWEGHHQSFNYTIAGDAAPSMTPSFFGTNPGEVMDGPHKGLRVLGNEEELGRTLVKSLNEEQRKVAIILAEAPKEVLDVPGRNDSKPEGISYSALDVEQKVQLIKLIKTYLYRCRPDVAAEDWAKVEAGGMEKLFFAWAGGVERGQPHYYRAQAGSFVLEYDNVQNGANHVHSLWRDFDHDFGGDLLRKHYEQSHK